MTGISKRERFAQPLRDPILRALLAASVLAAVARGVFLTLTVLYFTSVIGLGAGEVAVVLTVSSALGVASTLLFGFLADLVSARRLQLILMLVQATALAAYSQAQIFSTVLAIACVVSFADKGANTARAAIIARGFVGQARVATRAVLRTGTNIGVAVGSAFASVPLLLGTGGAFRWTLIGAGLLTAAATLFLLRLPSSVDARTTASAAHVDTAAHTRSPLHDARYLVVTILAGVFGMQFAVFEVGIPQWVVGHTAAPPVVVSVLLVLNAVLVIALQIPLSRSAKNVRGSGRVFLFAGFAMAAACLLYALSGLGAGPWGAVILLIAGAALHSIAEVLSSAGGWGLSFDLADTRRAGAYQGVFGMGAALAAMAAPIIVTATVLWQGSAGWAALAALFLLSAILLYVVAWRASLDEHPPG